MNDAWLNRYDCAVVISGDSDLAESIKLVKQHHKKKVVGVISPGKRGMSKEMTSFSYGPPRDVHKIGLQDFGHTRQFELPFRTHKGESDHVQSLRLLPRVDLRPVDVNPKRIVAETVSGSVAASERPGFGQLLNKLEAGDVLVVTKLDRLGRNAMDVRAAVEALTGMGVWVHCLALGGVAIGLALASAGAPQVRERC